MTIKLVAPTINLNGTSHEALVRSYHDAAEAVAAAIRVHADTYPHGRDYQTTTQERYHQAKREHLHRYARLLDVQRELAALAEAVYERHDSVELESSL